jgi:hypothetical protein
LSKVTSIAGWNKAIELEPSVYCDHRKVIDFWTSNFLGSSHCRGTNVIVRWKSISSYDL